jgi:MoxR-like ATPase
LLRQRLQDGTQPVPDAQIDRFLKENEGTYLADLL